MTADGHKRLQPAQLLLCSQQQQQRQARFLMHWLVHFPAYIQRYQLQEEVSTTIL